VLFAGIRGLLETTFDKVFLVTDKASLIEGALRLQPTIIVMDLSYAAGNLPDLVRELRHQAPMAKLLLLSVHDEPAVITSAMTAGADGLVVKRALGSDLIPAIDAVLAGQRYFFSSVAY
jgi:DNA-binding NarL/FixJ family response regulator